MSSKRWLLLFPLLIILGYLIVLGFVYVVNPTYKYDNRIFENNKISYDIQFSRTLFDKLKEKKHTLVFGTSRSHLIDSTMLQKDVLNLHSIHGRPDSVYSFLDQLNHKQLSNIDEIFYLVDIHTVNIKGVYIDYNRKEFDIVKKITVTKVDIVNSFESFFSNSFITPNGYPSGVDKNKKSIVHDQLKPINSQDYTLKGVEMIGKINEFCINNDLKITYITPTFPDKTLNSLNLIVEKEKWTKLLDIGVDKFYAFWWVDGVSNLKQNDYYLSFHDASHLNYSAMRDIVSKLNNDNMHVITNLESLNLYFDYMESQLNIIKYQKTNE